MPQTAIPPSAPTPDTAHPVQWFAQSKRLIGGKPDARYGWLDTAQGPCIVKALEPSLTAYASTLLGHERTMLQRLVALNAPVPPMVESPHADWVVTRFAGLSLQHLQGSPQAYKTACVLGFAESVSVWVHLLRRLQPMASQGVIAMDLYEGNVVVPLTGGTSGQLRLNEPVLIDHAHTVEAGMGLRRPVWLALNMEHIAPELREAVHADQDALRETFAQLDADLPGYSRMPGERDAHNRRAWAQYDAPQRLQSLLDQGQLSADKAMQFAIGSALARLMRIGSPLMHAEALQHIVQRMLGAEPAQRFASMLEAADALQAQFAALPLVSNARLAAVGPHTLADGAPARAAGATRVADSTHTALAQQGFFSLHSPLPQTAMPARAVVPCSGKRLKLRAWPTWVFAALATGTAIGAGWPL